MYRVYELTEKEKTKFTCLRWDGDTHYYDVFDSAAERDAEQRRLDRIDEEYRKAKKAYLASSAF